MRKLPPVAAEQIERIKEMKLQGATWAQVAEVLALTEHQCKDSMKRLGFKAAHPGILKSSVYKKVTVVVKEQAHPIPPGVPTLPPLPCTLEPVYMVDWSKYR